MQAQRQPRTTWRTVLMTCAAVALACRPEYEEAYEPVEAELPPGAESASARITVRVPEGDWSFWVVARGVLQLRSAPPPPMVVTSAPEPSSCGLASCQVQRFELDCPAGFCSYTFDVAAGRGRNRDVALSAGIAFLTLDYEPDESQGCDRKKSPNYVPPEERARLFEVVVAPYDVVVVPLDDGGAPSTPPAGLDAGATAGPSAAGEADAQRASVGIDAAP